MKKYFKGFFYFSMIFLGILSLLVIPDAIVHKDFANLFIFLLISAFLIGLSIYFYRLFISCAAGLSISDDHIAFLYENRTAAVAVSDIQKIIVTPYRYIFVSTNEKNYVTRILGFLRCEKKIDPKISDFAAQHNIPLLTKFLP